MDQGTPLGNAPKHLLQKAFVRVSVDLVRKLYIQMLFKAPTPHRSWIQ
jgi:hypothetical protein